jgi:hypothetical protein
LGKLLRNTDEEALKEKGAMLDGPIDLEGIRDVKELIKIIGEYE